jgi:hypothetical protein
MALHPSAWFDAEDGEGAKTVSEKAESIPKPPQPPEFKPRLQFYPFQYAGMALIFLLPILALLNVFSSHTDTTSASGNNLRLEVTYPSRILHDLHTQVEIRVENTADQPLSDVVLRIEKSYGEMIGGDSISPSVTSITEDFYEVALPDFSPGESQLVTISGYSDGARLYTGTIEARVSGASDVSLHVESIVFP